MFLGGVLIRGHPCESVVDVLSKRRGLFGGVWVGAATIRHRNLIRGGCTMKKHVFLVPLGALLLVNFANAQSALNGTWKVDMSKVDFSKKPDVFLLQNGMYECKTCTPAYKVKADGSDQP